jgi:hypothetical protein
MASRNGNEVTHVDQVMEDEAQDGEEDEEVQGIVAVPFLIESTSLILHRGGARTLPPPGAQGDLISSIVDGQHRETWQWRSGTSITGHITLLAVGWTTAAFAKHTLLQTCVNRAHADLS